MGVISKNDRKIGRYSSESNESLHIPQPSDDDDGASGVSEMSQPPLPARQRNRRQHRMCPVPLTICSPRKRIGKKRNRRYENVFQLETLVEDEELKEVSIDDFIPESSGGFKMLFENENCLEVWEHFMDSPECEQLQVIQKRAQLNVKPKNNQQFLTEEDAYQRIAHGLRSKLRKCRVPLGMIEPLENELVEFFSTSPTGTYVSDSLTSFQRMLLHAVAQYYSLMARSFDSLTDNVRLVRISNSYGTFQKPPIMFMQFLDNRRRGVFHSVKQKVPKNINMTVVEQQQGLLSAV